MKRLVILAALLAAIFAGNRIAGAAYQCWGFSHTAACLVNDILTGEDL